MGILHGRLHSEMEKTHLIFRDVFVGRKEVGNKAIDKVCLFVQLLLVFGLSHCHFSTAFPPFLLFVCLLFPQALFSLLNLSNISVFSSTTSFYIIIPIFSDPINFFSHSGKTIHISNFSTSISKRGNTNQNVMSLIEISQWPSTITQTNSNFMSCIA